MVRGDRLLPTRSMTGKTLPFHPGDGMGDLRSGVSSVRLIIASQVAGGTGVNRAASVVSRNRFLPALSVACQALSFHADNGVGNR